MTESSLNVTLGSVAIVLFVAGCFYAKRSILKGVIVSWISPLVVAPIWGMLYLLTSGLIILVAHVLPGPIAAVQAGVADWPMMATYLLHPATLLTVAVFVLYCRKERENADLPSGHVSMGSRIDGSPTFARVVGVRKFG